MQLTTHYVPTATQLKEAIPFTHFDAPLEVIYDHRASELLKKKYYEVMKSFRYYLNEEQKDTWAYVPAGFLTDGASIPKPFWWLLPPWGSYGQAAVLHDILCETETMFRQDIPVHITRKKADKIFLEAMKHLQVAWYIRFPMYAAVRLWGMFGWRPSVAKTQLKRQLETEYMKAHGTYRDPTAILKQVNTALYSQIKKSAEVQQQPI